MTGDDAFERAFWLAIEDMKQGEERSLESYLRLVPADQRKELGRMLADVLAARGPAPPAAAAESEGYRRAAAIVDEVMGARGAAGILPGTLKAIRNARGIEPEGVVERLAGDFGVRGEGGRRALARNYHRLETGRLLGSNLSRRLLDSLAAVFGVDPAEVAAAARPAKGPPLTGAPAMGRGGGSRAPSPPPSAERLPDPEVDLVERLFHGGFDA